MIRFRGAVENLNISLSAGLLPTFTRLLDGAVVPLVSRLGKFAEANPKLTSTIVSLSTGLIGLRLAGLLASFSLRWMWGGALATAAGSLRLVAGGIRLVTSATKLLRLAMIHSVRPSLA